MIVTCADLCMILPMCCLSPGGFWPSGLTFKTCPPDISIRPIARRTCRRKGAVVNRSGPMDGSTAVSQKAADACHCSRSTSARDLASAPATGFRGPAPGPVPQPYLKYLIGQCLLKLLQQFGRCYPLASMRSIREVVAKHQL